jgi:hypothetical protein
MAREVRTYAVTVAAGGSAGAPVTTDLDMPARIVQRIRVRVPPGPSGEVGFALGSAGQRVIPWGGETWLVADDESLDWTPVDAISSGAWQLIAYNTGTYDHTVYVTFDLDPPGGSGSGGVASLLPLAGLTG